MVYSMHKVSRLWVKRECKYISVNNCYQWGENLRHNNLQSEGYCRLFRRLPKMRINELASLQIPVQTRFLLSNQRDAVSHFMLFPVVKHLCLLVKRNRPIVHVTKEIIYKLFMLWHRKRYWKLTNTLQTQLNFLWCNNIVRVHNKVQIHFAMTIRAKVGIQKILLLKLTVFVFSYFLQY